MNIIGNQWKSRAINQHSIKPNEVNKENKVIEISDDRENSQEHEVKSTRQSEGTPFKQEDIRNWFEQVKAPSNYNSKEDIFKKLVV